MKSKDEMKIAEVAVELDLSTNTVYKLVRDKRLKQRIIIVNGRRSGRFDRSEVLELKKELISNGK